MFCVGETTGLVGDENGDLADDLMVKSIVGMLRSLPFFLSCVPISDAGSTAGEKWDPLGHGKNTRTFIYVNSISSF